MCRRYLVTRQYWYSFELQYSPTCVKLANTQDLCWLHSRCSRTDICIQHEIRAAWTSRMNSDTLFARTKFFLWPLFNRCKDLDWACSCSILFRFLVAVFQWSPKCHTKSFIICVHVPKDGMNNSLELPVFFYWVHICINTHILA